MKVWLVWGSTGEYSDRTEWVVAVYTTQEQAELHKEKAQERANEINTQRGNQRFTTEGLSSVYDPQLSMDYTGTTYNMTESLLVRHVDEFLEIHGQ